MEGWISQIVSGQLFAWMLIFARVGTAFMSMPGVGDIFVPARVRLFFALAVSALLTPILAPGLPSLPTSVLGIFVLVAAEVFYGALLGMLARLLVATVETAGMMISMQVSLSNASVFNPAMASQGSLIGSLFGVLAIVLLFATNMHHFMLAAVVDSYTVFAPGTVPPFDSVADYYAKMVNESFVVATQLSAPFLVLGLAFYLAMGLVSRLMPQLQIFFIALPAQIYFGFIVLSLVLSATALFWLSYAQRTLGAFLDVGP